MAAESWPCLSLEQDPSTQQERALAQNPSVYAEQRPLPQRLDMLTGRIPGTNMVVGLSRRLYEACKNLADQDQQPGAGEDRPEEEIAVAIAPEKEYERFDLDERVDQYTRERRAAFVDRERDAARRARLSVAAREGFEYGRNNSWRQLLEQEQEPRINSDPTPGLLESATADTYLAIDRLSVVP